MTENQAKKFFYDERDSLTRPAARKVLSQLWHIFGVPRSVIDVGCGVGTWLAVARELGVEHIEGLEGPWVAEVGSLAIPRERIRLADLEANLTIERNFELGISLEVAEHLSTQAGARLVERLATSCERILFSAALPGQGGEGHINERWPTYWQELFARQGFEALDCIRTLIWYDSEIPWWYRQNIVLYVKPDDAARYYRALSKYPDLRPRYITAGYHTRETIKQYTRSPRIARLQAVWATIFRMLKPRTSVD